jgi:hypothetical protein
MMAQITSKSRSSQQRIMDDYLWPGVFVHEVILIIAEVQNRGCPVFRAGTLRTPVNLADIPSIGDQPSALLISP